MIVDQKWVINKQVAFDIAAIRNNNDARVIHNKVLEYMYDKLLVVRLLWWPWQCDAWETDAVNPSVGLVLIYIGLQ